MRKTQVKGDLILSMIKAKENANNANERQYAQICANKSFFASNVPIKLVHYYCGKIKLN